MSEMMEYRTEDKELIEVIIKEIRSAAEEEVKRILKGAKEEAKSIVEEAKLKAKEIREEKIKTLMREFRARLRREVAPKRLEIRNRFIKERYRMLSEFFDNISKEIILKIRSNEELHYKFIEQCLKEVIRAIKGTTIIVYPCENDVKTIKEVIDKVKKKYAFKKDIDIKIADPIECVGGLVAVTEDGRKYYNSTLESKLELLKEEIISELISKLQDIRD